MIRIFSDFDGTIVREDVGNAFFRTFAPGKAEEIVRGYLDGTMNARDCLTGECAAVPEMDRRTFEEFADGFRVDPTFPPFAEFCRMQEIPLTVLSDGLDVYVERILRRAGLGALPWFANHAEFVARDGVSKVQPSFPWRDSECDWCGNCKRNHMVVNSADEDLLVYIGDGISDRCPVRYADVIFAKRSLIVYCQKENITYHEFKDFNDVRMRLEVLIAQKRKRQRREAVMARRDVFLRG
ncbi:MAG: hypothetical protein A2X67_10635 [Ignavibacteria bacterium GWA2_55_11]|nr:MAG: hypothetical protein A2X67_10635 [Ignavibacteria bacterium GWA2_55_11]OGU44000.1 MAG: hypothetical protein A2X68_02355 [Ignavibacteria bacterium GWC2_56_12]OGU71735.1 MAG: hypothetical protein A3H45_04440 [Ignavibacteria bacterium RIFCSPLOWO2_02_FULL_55_14]